jgi:hypothetical protein
MKIDVLERDAALWKEPAREIQKSRYMIER